MYAISIAIKRQFFIKTALNNEDMLILAPQISKTAF